MSGGDPGGVPVDETVLGIVDFPTVRRGYAPDKVRAFVSAAHAELRRLTDDNARLRLRIERLQVEAEVAAQALDEAKRVSAEPSLPPPAVAEATVEAVRAPVSDWNQVADDLVRGARAESDAIVASARRDAASIVDRANAEAMAVLDRANNDAMALRREAHESSVLAGSSARAELAQVERQRVAIAASLTALQRALADAVESMGPRSSGSAPLDPPSR